MKFSKGSFYTNISHEPTLKDGYLFTYRGINFGEYKIGSVWCIVHLDTGLSIGAEQRCHMTKYKAIENETDYLDKVIDSFISTDIAKKKAIEWQKLVEQTKKENEPSKYAIDYCCEYFPSEVTPRMIQDLIDCDIIEIVDGIPTIRQTISTYDLCIYIKKYLYKYKSSDIVTMFDYIKTLTKSS